jgi:CRISPR-associated endonuclease/helicase Cas3
MRKSCDGNPTQGRLNPALFGSRTKNTRAAITSLINVNPEALREVTVAEENVIRPVIRRRDLMDLFDTTPDICRQEIDASRYLREATTETCSSFCAASKARPRIKSFCRIAMSFAPSPFGDAMKFLGKKLPVWRWNPLSEE